jgi:hypothetical protein
MADPALGRSKLVLTAALDVAVVLVAIIVLFVVEPPRLTPAGSHVFVRAAEFICAIAILIFIGAARFGGWRPPRVALAAIILLAISVLALFLYLYLLGSWTCEYDGRGPIVIGETMNRDALDYARTIPGAGCDRIIQDYGGRTGDIWPPNQLLSRHLMLAGAFLATVISFSLAALCAIEAFGARPAGKNAG